MKDSRWPKSMHSQVEAVFHAIRDIRKSKTDSMQGIRSFGAWKVYRYETHRFVNFMLTKKRTSILNIQDVQDDMENYLENQLDEYIRKKCSLQTFETILSALAKFETAVNHYIETHMSISPILDTEKIRKGYYAKGKKRLPKSSKSFDNRAYPDPLSLIEAITDGTCQLQASLQYEGGLRAEGVGAPSNKRLKNPLSKKGLRGIIDDPVTGLPVGVVASVEKGGKETEHYVSVETYQRLEEYIEQHGKLEIDYVEYCKAINQAALSTNQHAPGRGSHGLKHNFAQERYQECVAHGKTHEESLQQTSLETSHFRLRETLGYTRGR